MLTNAQVSQLLDAIDVYETNCEYDSVFCDVHDRLAAAGAAGKLDIAALVFWKRAAQGKWVKKFLSTPEETVLAATRAAFAAAQDGSALVELAVLDGFKTMGPIATTVLCAFNPDHWAVMDRRALRGLTRLGHGLPRRRRGRTVAYLRRVRELRDCLRRAAMPSERWRQRQPGITARDVDKGLFVIGK